MRESPGEAINSVGKSKENKDNFGSYFVIYMGKSHHLITELFKNENKGIVFKPICVSVFWYNTGESLFLRITTHPAVSLFYLK